LLANLLPEPGLGNEGAVSRRIYIGALILLGLVLLTGGALWITLDPGLPEPSEAHWSKAGEVIAAGFEEGDGVRIHPFWLQVPSALVAPFDGQRPDVDVSLPPDPIFLATHRRLWQVTAFGRTDAPPVPGGELLEERSLDGHLTLSLYRLADSPVAVDLLDRLDTATVERFGPGKKRRRCKWNGREHHCNGRPWENVGVSTRQAGGAPRRCMVLHPYPDRGTVAVTWKNVPLAAGVLIRHGFTLDAARNEKGSDATIRVLVDGEKQLEVVEPRNSWEWTPSWIATPQGGRRATVTIEVTARREEFRDLCLDAFVLTRRLD